MKWQDLTSADFSRAIAKAEGVCLLPMGSVEKFGPTAPLGTNLYLVRAVAEAAAAREYAVVFPDYFAAGTSSVRNFPGAVSYSVHLQYELLQETAAEMARNGCRKILIVNGHTGNVPLINLFVGDLADSRRYVAYSVYGLTFRAAGNIQPTDFPAAARPSKPGVDGHGGEERVSAMLAVRPDLVHLDRAREEFAVKGTKTVLPESVATGLSHLAESPTGYEGDAAGATAARGRALMEYGTRKVAESIRAIKADRASPEFQQQFLDTAADPLTKQLPLPANR
ncbi:MAG TPA: creatininase family protein [Dyella sp.]|uniref:creatininase family protein n=1 Tax=Dyella sp. TaxID=1869338 RepID=UPI002D773F59|nr:creatininase family protein [Dyella sp.]HET6554688.1 creatininase family protein [Dyella sp.]